jgi:hypothetical protein
MTTIDADAHVVEEVLSIYDNRTRLEERIFRLVVLAPYHSLR